jgi:hypothetical protein
MPSSTVTPFISPASDSKASWWYEQDPYRSARHYQSALIASADSFAAAGGYDSHAHTLVAAPTTFGGKAALLLRRVRGKALVGEGRVILIVERPVMGTPGAVR